MCFAYVLVHLLVIVWGWGVRVGVGAEGVWSGQEWGGYIYIYIYICGTFSFPLLPRVLQSVPSHSAAPSEWAL